MAQNLNLELIQLKIINTYITSYQQQVSVNLVVVSINKNLQYIKDIKDKPNQVTSFK